MCWAPHKDKSSPRLQQESQLRSTLYRSFIVTLYIVFLTRLRAAPDGRVMLGLVIKIEVQLMGLDTRGSAQGLEHKVILWKYLWAIFYRVRPGCLLCPPPGTQTCQEPRLCQWTHWLTPSCGPGTRGSRGREAAKSDDNDTRTNDISPASSHHTSAQPDS